MSKSEIPHPKICYLQDKLSLKRASARRSMLDRMFLEEQLEELIVLSHENETELAHRERLHIELVQLPLAKKQEEADFKAYNEAIEEYHEEYRKYTQDAESISH